MHRLDENGKWQNIDNRLFLRGNVYESSDGRFSFAETISDLPVYTVNDGKYSLSSAFISERVNGSHAEIENHKEKPSLSSYETDEEKIASFADIDTTTRVMYKGVLENIDLEYIISANDVKENIVLGSPGSPNEYSFRLDLLGLDAELNENGDVLLVDTESGETVYTIPAPYMYDTNGTYSYDVYYELSEGGENSYVLTIIADGEWLASPDTVYPVVIDPSVSQNVAYDSYIYSSTPDTNYGSSATLWVSSSRITYIRKPYMPTIPTYAKITHATLSTYYYYYDNITSGSVDIGLYNCEKYWDESSITWNVANAWSNLGLSTTRSAITTATATNTTHSSTPGIISFIITDLVKQYYETNSNYGVGLKYEGGPNASVILKSSEAAGYSPYFTVTYSVITPTIQNGTYFLKNGKLGNYVQIDNDDASNNYSTNDAILELFDFDGNSYQKWIFTFLHNGYYKIISQKSSKAISVKSGQENSGDVALRQQTYTADFRQQWAITSAHNGQYKIKAHSSEGYSTDRVMAAGDGIGTNGRNVEQRKYVNNTSYLDERIIIECSDTVQLESQKQSMWCWAASARMASKKYMISPVHQEMAAVYVKLGIKTTSPNASQISMANNGGTVGETEQALEFILGSSNVYSKWGKIYRESVLRSLIDSGNPVVILRGWYDSGSRDGGHYVIIYDYWWNSSANMYVYDIYDPSPVNIGSSYSRSYQSICNGHNIVYGTDIYDDGIWEGIVVYEMGTYQNTINWPGV